MTKVAGVDADGFPIASTSGDSDDAQNYLLNPQGLVWHEGALYLRTLAGIASSASMSRRVRWSTSRA